MSAIIYSTSFRRVAMRSNRIVSPLLTGWLREPLPAAEQQQRRGLATPKKKKGKGKRAIIGGHGSRGHGWFIKYREGRGGRHLQGEYWDRTQHHWDLAQWNDAVLSLGSQYVYLDVAVEPPSAETVDRRVRDMMDPSDISVALPEPQDDHDESLAVASQRPHEETSEETHASADEPLFKTERLVIRVASTVMPETCLNFIGLLQEAAYKDSILYRIEKQVGICGGDILTNTGKTGQCWQHWPANMVNTRIRPNPLRRDLPSEEPLAMWHTAGTVAMLCATVDEIDSRFILCLNDAPHLDGIHRAFGTMSHESLAIIQEWQTNVITYYGKPKSATLRIVGGGVLEGYDDRTQQGGASSKEDQGAAA